jgi:hypothetical protein
VNYYKDYNDARKVLEHVATEHPEARIVGYGLGYAVQFQKSGAYFPDDMPVRLRKMNERIVRENASRTSPSLPPGTHKG